MLNLQLSGIQITSNYLTGPQIKHSSDESFCLARVQSKGGQMWLESWFTGVFVGLCGCTLLVAVEQVLVWLFPLDTSWLGYFLEVCVRVAHPKVFIVLSHVLLDQAASFRLPLETCVSALMILSPSETSPCESLSTASVFLPTGPSCKKCSVNTRWMRAAVRRVRHDGLSGPGLCPSCAFGRWVRGEGGNRQVSRQF